MSRPLLRIILADRIESRGGGAGGQFCVHLARMSASHSAKFAHFREGA